MASLRIVRRARGERGAELIEFALVFPMLLLVMLGILDFGFLFQRYLTLTNAAREGARVAVLGAVGYTQTDVQNRVTQYLAASGMTATPTYTWTAPQAVPIGGGACMTLTGITVSYPHNYLFLGPIVGLMGGSGFNAKTLTATARMRFEGPAAACP